MTGHYLSLSNTNDIDPRLLQKGFTEDQIKQMRNSMGSNSIVGGNLKFTSDIKKFKHPDFNYIYSIFDAWDNHNALPFSGGYTDQPNKIIDYMQILDGLKHESEQKARAQAEREQRAASKKRK